MSLSKNLEYLRKSKKKGKYEWIRPNGTVMTQRDIILHIESILEGRFSMGFGNDIAIIEERIKTDPLLKQYSYKGVPDVRIICFNLFPLWQCYDYQQKDQMVLLIFMQAQYVQE